MKYKPSISSLPKLSQVQNKKEQEETLKNINKFFKDNTIKAKVKGYDLGPVITKYHTYLLKTGKYRDITKSSEEIALAIGSKVGYIHITGPVPGKHYFDIETVNKETLTLPLRYFLESSKMQKDDTKTLIPIGFETHGGVYTSDIRDLPHLLITGMKGSGKTTFLHTIITSLILRNSPEELKFLIISPKTTQFDVYKKIPYLAKPLIKNTEKIEDTIKWLAEELYVRYNLFWPSRSEGIERYNEVNKEKMGRIVLIVDDLSKCFNKTPKAVESYLVKIAQRGRAAGIHMFISSTDIKSNYIAGLVKANIPGRVAFKIKDSRSSINFLFRSGAHNLLGRGDMLYLPPYSSNDLRLQAPYITKEDVEKLVKKIVV